MCVFVQNVFLAYSFGSERMWSKSWNCNAFDIKMKGANATPLDDSDLTKAICFAGEDVRMDLDSVSGI